MGQRATATSPTLEPSVAPARSDVDAWGPAVEAPAARRYARERRVARDLVELSRLERGAERAEFAPLDLARLLGAVRADYPQVFFDGPASAIVKTDSRRLARVLFVLLDNAHVHGSAPVEVRYDERAIVVSDSGPGFAPRLIERATEPFVTGEHADGRGIGLGLAIAARQMALLGGTLEVSNQTGAGARVAVLLGEPGAA